MTTVAVVGGGLAGITAALRCADAGASVTLFESRSKLGGLTHSFRRGELDVDNGQHVFLRCCTSYLALLERLGVDGKVTLQPRLAIPVRAPGHATTTWLRRSGLPAPGHLAATLLRYSPLRPAERLRFVRAALALRRVDPAAAATDAQSFGAWLAAHGQSPRAVERLWDLVGVATLNARAGDASLALAATVFQIGLLTRAGAADLGWSLVPLGELHGRAALAALEAAGVDVRTGAKVLAVEPAGRGWSVRTGGAEHPADQVIVAAPPDVAERLLPPGGVAVAPGWSARLGSSPIVNLHVVYDRTVLEGGFLAAVGSPIQWVFDRTRQSGLAEGQYLAVSLSAADGLIDAPVAQLRAIMMPALADLLPAARDARVRDFFVTRERHATFRPAPGSAADRPGPATALPGLWLAGAWTATGWPATMEGAVRSGESAAAGALSPRMSTLDGVAS
ncbi:hydroxysqualene dehydroxylase HpnE [Dactylosporangium sp. CA-092794]|uniref:hydroxysqualene dehydroxylase HpnE n=1 Tax=Dactylosporangium sp. CA-092794 TaxID=3239929 RepID=UPI003D902D9B